MSRRGWFLFLLVGFLWGIPYLFIKVAVDPENGFSPATVVCLRTAIGTAILIPIAIKQRQFENGCFIAFTGIVLNPFHSTENCD